MIGLILQLTDHGEYIMKLMRLFRGSGTQKRLANELNEYYAFAERNYQRQYEQVDLTVDYIHSTLFTPVSGTSVQILNGTPGTPWEEYPNTICYYDGSDWQFSSPWRGMVVYNAVCSYKTPFRMDRFFETR